ncbi:MAG TPA: [protein-PII] uridylyltransferase [Bacteroidetes bacterium]|nr:[protein-PII] uridylyltransferase [Bacteroidota bacterium]
MWRGLPPIDLKDMTISKDHFAQQLRSIIQLHRRGGGGLRVALRLTRRLDDLISRVFDGVDLPQKHLVTIVALGGYGRKELCFSSDADVMFLIRNEDVKKEASPVVRQLLHDLLDYGLDVGHSFRTVQECVAFSTSDFESWNSLLEARYLCGDRRTFATMRSEIAARIKVYDKAEYVRKLLGVFELRHRKYGTSTKLLEPNIKNSAGGLRDLHSVLWLMCATGQVRLHLHPQTTALSALLRSPAMRKQFSPHFLREARQSLDELLRVRNEMHLRGKGLHDSLEFSFQRQVAEALNYRPTSKRTSVERFMQDYYVAVRIIAQLAQRITNWANDHAASPPAPLSRQRIEKPFGLRGHKIDLRHRASTLSSEDGLRAFLLSLDLHAPFSHRLEDALSRSGARFTPLKSINETALFRELLNKEQGVGQALHKMNDLGLLARWIPEWKPLVAFFQHNIYHYYTADEHTLMVLMTAEGLQDSASSFGDVFRKLPRRDTLYLACLLHDIAKPVRIGDHEIVGVDMARAILKRLRYEDVLDEVLFLVRNHLMMEQVAFRRNLGDPQTILDFASKFRSVRQLDYLYLLTYADLSAVNKNVWTDWKGMLLLELYRRSREILDRKLTSVQFEEAELRRHEAAVQELVSELSTALPEHEARGHLNALDSPAYLTAFDSQEIAEHIRRIAGPETVSTIFGTKNDYTEITVIARDAPFALSKFCGVLAANDANIFDAQIFTRNDGIIIDKFRVTDFITKTALSEPQHEKIHAELNEVFNGTIDIQHLLHKHRMKWRRKSRHLNPNIRIDVEFEDHPSYSIIDVFAPDMLGFLYKVTETMSRLGLNISFAKIATRVDGIVDSFYVTDQAASKIENPERVEFVKKEILQTISALTESELVSG